jgi:A/G-specific adenine glycosylase
VAQQLPGIGRYTAGAVLSIAYDARLPVLEANTIRLLARLLGYEGDPRSAAGQRTLWEAAEALLPRRQVGRWNQALMELGATICTPRGPRCDVCPLQGECAARRSGRQDEIPRRGPRVPFQQVHAAAMVIGHRGGVLVLKRSAGGRWGGLWDFPRLEFPSTPIPDDAARRRWIQYQAAAAWGLRLELGACFATLRHGVTRYRITLDCFTARLARRPAADYPWRTPEGEIQRVTLPQLEQLAMTRTARRIAQLLGDAVPECR